MKKSFSKIRHIQESNLILEKRLIKEQFSKEQRDKDGVTYTVQKVPSGKYKIFVTDATHKTPTDATIVNGGGDIWKEYNTDVEAYNVIRDIISSSENSLPRVQPSGD